MGAVDRRRLQRAAPSQCPSFPEDEAAFDVMLPFYGMHDSAATD